jgi:hypothetical protein
METLKNLKAERTGTDVMTSAVRVQYPNVVEPRAQEGDNGETKYQYSIMLLVKPDDPLIAVLKEAAKEAASKKWPNKLPTITNNPFKDGDTKRYGGAAGHVCIDVKCSSKDKPAVLAQDGKTVITDPKAIYAGCWVRVLCNAGAWENAKFRTAGVSFWLKGVQLLAQDEPLGNFTPADKMFGAVVSADSPFEKKDDKVDADVDNLFA